MIPHPDPRRRRIRPYAPPIDAVVAAARLELAAESLRADQLARGPVPEPARDDGPLPTRVLPPVPAPRPDDDPRTGLLDLAAVRAMVAAGGPSGAPANPASMRWLRGEPEPPVDPVVEWLPRLATTYPCRVLGNAVHNEPCGPQHVDLPLAESVAEWARAVPGPPPVPSPAAPAEPLPNHAPAGGPGPAGAPQLAWASRHDPRSLSYGVRDRLLGSAPMADRLWPVGPVLDQGAEGACVGCGTADATNVLRLMTPPAAMLGLPEALALFRRADAIDGDGQTGVGTSVLAGMTAGVQAGYFDHYLWAFGTRDIAQAVLQLGPVVIGIPWLSGMYATGPGGLVELAGEDTGAGHCLVIVGLTLTGPQGQPGPFFVWQNSWGPGYGEGGLGYVHHRDLAALLHGTGEAAIPVRGRA